MSADITDPAGTIVPTLRYHDVAAAIGWLCNAFGFEEHHLVHADDGRVRYAQLTFGSGMIMLGPVESSGLDKVMAQPADTGGAETQICYLFVADAAAHRDRAKAAGAEILLDIDDAHSNGRGYCCRDFEGHVWNFGTYDPWKRRGARPAAPSRGLAGRRGRLYRVAMAAAAILAIAAAIAMLGRAQGLIDVSSLGPRSDASASVGEGGAGEQPGSRARELEASDGGSSAASDRRVSARGESRIAVFAVNKSQAELVREPDARETAERLAKEAGETLARAETERALEDARRQLALERSAREDAQRGAQEARERLSIAERTSEAAQEQLAAERDARQTAEVAAREARQQLAKEQSSKEAAERTLKETQASEAREHAAARRPPPRPRGLPAGASRKPLVNWEH
jgi:uncharacterized glyoxalase superfamily protein PhnB